jgi:non-ribosomal peptide synthetase component E (peptide arylation enzyme)
MFSFEEMRRFLENQKLAKQKWPERLETLDEFPLNAAGKIQKHHLRQRIAEKLGYPASRK